MAKCVSGRSRGGRKGRKHGKRINMPTVLICLVGVVTLFSLSMNVLMFRRFHTPLYKARDSAGEGTPVGPPDMGEAATEALLLFPRRDGGGNSNRLLGDGSCAHNDGEDGVCLAPKVAVTVSPTCVPQQTGSIITDLDSVFINLDHGDPIMYEPYWTAMEKCSIIIPGWQTMSYFSRVGGLCWFMEPRLAEEIVRLHKLVGNARTDGRHIVVGTGSTQLFQAALYALSPPETEEPISVVSGAPYFSSYPAVTDFLRSGLYRWAGDAFFFHEDDAPYIELVCSPNNPDGLFKEAVVNKEKGKTVHDLAYYWPQYAPITAAASHDIMLFTFSKLTGHAGTRIGWAVVKDRDIAERMTKFIELNTIGVSKDSQLRAAQILGALSDGYELRTHTAAGRFFDYGRRLMSERWERLREAVQSTGSFSLPDFPSANCSFTGEKTPLLPAFAWLKCEREDVDDCREFLKSHNILTRSGRHFGSGPRYVRVSMLDRDESFNLFIRRLFSMG